MSYADLMRRVTGITLITTPTELLEKAAEYCDYVEATPLQSQNAAVHKGDVTVYQLDKARAMTLKGFAAYLGLTVPQLRGTDTSEAWNTALAKIEQVFYTQKYELAAAGLLNASIVSRELGLADKVDNTSSDGSMTPKSTIDMGALSTEALAELAAATGAYDDT
jgi:hypothetical protein